MNNIERKGFLKNKIALAKELIAKKEIEAARSKETLDWINESIISLNQELWKDEFALEELENGSHEEIPTLALHKKNPLWKEIVEQ